MKNLRNDSTVFISGLSLGSNPNDKVAILTLIDVLSNDDYDRKFTYALPLSVLEEMKAGIDEAIADLKDS